MINNKVIKIFKSILISSLVMLSACSQNTAVQSNKSNTDKPIELVWYQIGDIPSDYDMVIEKVNEYTEEKIGVTVKINYVSWGDYNNKMQVIQNTGEEFDLAFTAPWANNYLQNAQKGMFHPLDDLLLEYGQDIYNTIDERFWEASKIAGHIYAVPNEKEIALTPMWVFTKEYVDKYDIPYESIKTLDDLAPWLEIIKKNEPDVVPFYITKDYTIPLYFDLIFDPIGIEYGDDTLTVKSLYDTEQVKDSIMKMRDYFNKGYINGDALITNDDKSIKRFVTKGDGQPFADLIWSKDLGYEVVSTTIMDSVVTNSSARGAMTAVSQTSKHPEKAVEFINLVNTDEYLRNLLNYGVEGIHYEKIPISDEDKIIAETTPYTYDFKITLNKNKIKDYSVPYWVQGSLFNTYVTDTEPIDKWSIFKQTNDAAVFSPSFGFDFNTDNVMTEISGFRNILDEYGKALHTGSVDPDEYLPQIQEKLEASGIHKVIEDMQEQIDAWKTNNI